MQVSSETPHNKTAFITGISGQDGYYLARLLLTKGYVLHGLLRASSKSHRGLGLLRDEMPEAMNRLNLHYGDITDADRVQELIVSTQPDEVYHLAAQSHVSTSFDSPEYTSQVNLRGTINVLEAARQLNKSQEVRVYQASSSEMFGGLPETAPQSETTPFHPRSPYAVAKVAAFEHTIEFRQKHGLFSCSGILFNHESPLRGENYVTRKVTLGAARIKMGQASELSLGNLDVYRDWGFAGEYVEAMWLMLQQPEPEDFVIATGKSHSVREFVDLVFRRLELDYEDYVRIDPRFFRPAEVQVVCGDPSKAREKLGWAAKTTLTELVNLMVDYELDSLGNRTS